MELYPQESYVPTFDEYFNPDVVSEDQAFQYDFIMLTYMV